jgi:hypothetical protein
LKAGPKRRTQNGARSAESHGSLMQNLSGYLVPVTLSFVLIILVAGLWNMMRGGSPNTSQKMMRARVIAQFVAIIVAMGALWLAGR